METLTLEKGVFETPEIEVTTSDELPSQHTESQRARFDGHESQAVDTACVVGALAIVGSEARTAEAPSAEPGSAAAAGEQDIVEPTPSARYGYREDSPPEVIALLHQAQAGDRESFAELYRMHVERVRRYVTARMWDEDRTAVPDVVQDAFCEAFADLPSAHHDVKGWLLAHAAKAYIRFVRADRQQGRVVTGVKEQVRREYAHGYARQHPGDITAIGHVMLVHALARLTPSQREVVQHRYLDGQSQAATAILTGKKLKAAKSAEYRALVKLREGLDVQSPASHN